MWLSHYAWNIYQLEMKAIAKNQIHCKTYPKIIFLQAYFSDVASLALKMQDFVQIQILRVWMNFVLSCKQRTFWTLLPESRVEKYKVPHVPKYFGVFKYQI